MSRVARPSRRRSWLRALRWPLRALAGAILAGLVALNIQCAAPLAVPRFIP